MINFISVLILSLSCHMLGQISLKIDISGTVYHKFVNLIRTK